MWTRYFLKPMDLTDLSGNVSWLGFSRTGKQLVGNTPDRDDLWTKLIVAEINVGPGTGNPSGEITPGQDERGI